MFSLDDSDLDKTILGCGDGPASFNTELTRQGGKIISIDPVYQFTSDQLRSRIESVYQEIMPQMALSKDKYLWQQISTVEALGEIRMKAMNQFLDDFDEGKKAGRYITAELPNLPFDDKQFELALCSHYLFLYSLQVNYSNHLKQILELTRVAKEVRIYPLVALDGEQSEHLTKISDELSGQSYNVRQVEIEYRFQKNACNMMIITRI